MNLQKLITTKRRGTQGSILLMSALAVSLTVAWKKPFKDKFNSQPYKEEVYRQLPEDDKRDPKYAVAGLKTAEGLETTLFAAEPTLVNPTNIDVDAKGRVWVCEAYNYRTELNPKNPTKAEGDRILILEDTNGDGQADNTKVFYQGNDINAALGVWVMGNKVIVSCSPNIFVFTDTNGDDKPDSKEVFFTGIGGEQHDHAVHAVVFGPDGKLYFNFGNAGDQIKDAKGNPVKDPEGNEVNAKGKPYRQGMVFRCNPDGSEFEVLAHNFRNNYEVAVDSYGTLWQSDNDDDGNKGVRINYVMEFGNYGYHDEMTGAAWQASRTNMETEIPKRHWHLNDPGVVPNLLQTGAGSPTGMIVYEGRLLPKTFWDQMIHCDAGPNVVRSYPVTKSGAGYEAKIVNVLEGVRDQWFRPSDVCVAPDGSLIISDWYDPGVGGHQAGDQERGRIFRVAPPQTSYKVPALDLATSTGAVEALKSPNLSTRYLAWQKVHSLGKKAEKDLLKLWASDNDRFRARAIWLLAKIEGREKKYIDVALKDINPDIRITGLRIARQAKMDMIPYIKQLAKDLDPQVRREALIALRHSNSPEAPGLWTEMAIKYDGKDRWYLEALGISADKQWDKFFAAWWQKTGESGLKNAANRDIVWRARTKETIPLLASLASDPATIPSERPRYFRAFDFQDDPSKQDVLLGMLKGNSKAQAQISLLALRHIDPAKVQQAPEVKAELSKALVSVEGTQEYLDLVSRFSLKEQNPKLLKMAIDKSSNNLGIDAARLLLRQGGTSLITETFNSGDEKAISSLLTALGRINSKESMEFIETLVMDSKRPMALRTEAVRALGQGWSGEERLLSVVKSGKFPSELKPAAASTLMSAYRRDIREGAAQVLDIQGATSDKKLPPIGQLVAIKGDAQTGKAIFTRTCSACHQVNGEGIDFGPKLSEIGSKLSKEAQYLSILQPDAGISFGYEGYVVKLKDGSSLTGIIASQTEDEVDIRMPGGTGNRLSRKDIVSIQKMATSLMPSGLQQTMSEKELVDLVEYLNSLKKAS